MIRILSLALAWLLFGAAMAQAGPVAAAFTAVSTWVSATLAAGGFGAFALRLVAGLAFNAIGNALQKRAARRAAANQRDPGIRTSVTLTGGLNADGMIAGDYATGGYLVAPPLEHGANNVYNSAVIDLSGVPLTGLNRVFVNGSPIDLGATEQTVEGHNFGLPALGRFADHLWVKFHDGSQTAADPMLLARAGEIVPPILPLGNSKIFWDVGYANGVWVTVSSDTFENVNIFTSTNSVNWTSSSTEIEYRRYAVAYGNGKWVLAGSRDTIQVSTDATTWTTVNSGMSSGENIQSVFYGNSLWVAVGQNTSSQGLFVTSPDGTTWTRRSPFSSNRLTSVFYGNGLWVAVGSGGSIFTSLDGLTWAQRTSGTTNVLNGVAYGGGLWVAVGDAGTILTSIDAITWTPRSSGTVQNLYGVAYDGSDWRVVGATGTMLKSPSGLTWVAELSGTTNFLSSIAVGGGLWVAVGSNTIISGAAAGGAGQPAYPWTSDMVGSGRSYAICTYKFNREVWQGPPSFRFETASARFYDIRKDTTQGGSGGHRLDDPATWEATKNPMVMVAHLALGYTLPDGTIYGGGYSQTQLPLADWAAAMNACDALIAGIDGANEPTWRAGLEISFEDEPLEAINSLLQACDGEVVDRGGVLYPKVGAPGLPVAFISDDDLIVTQPETLEPFPGLQQTINGVVLSHPQPSVAWETVEAPRILRPDLEAEDGDRRLIQALTIPGCPYSGQIQRLGQAMVRDARRWRRHILALPRDLAWVRPLQTIAWTSARNGYSAKVFEVAEQAIDLWSYDAQVTLREVDPADYTPQAYEPVNTAIAVAPSSAPIALANAGAEAITLNDANGDPRRPAIRAFWDGFSGAGVEVEISRDGVIVSQTTAPSSASAAIVSGEIIANEVYSVRLRPVASGTPVAWSGPFAVTAPNVLLGGADLTENSVATANIVAGSVTLSGVVDAGAVTNDATTWDTVASLTLSDLPASAFLSGALEFRLTAGEADATNYPVDAEWRVTVAGVARRTIDRDLMLDRGGAYFTGYFTAEAVGPGDVVVVFEIRNMGGLGVESATLFAQAAMR